MVTLVVGVFRYGVSGASLCCYGVSGASIIHLATTSLESSSNSVTLPLYTMYNSKYCFTQSLVLTSNAGRLERILVALSNTERRILVEIFSYASSGLISSIYSVKMYV